jgi:DNA-directed RNA polymerase specialized sigma24 family protein
MTPGDDDSVTHWISVLKAGDERAAQELWQRYFTRMVELARAKLRAAQRPDAAVDAEDVALSAFHSFCAGAAQGRFPAITERDGLWRLLVVIASRKVLVAARRQRRLKRGGGLVQNASDVVVGHGHDEDDDLLARFVGTEPTPQTAAIVAEECRRLLEALGDATLRKVAVWRMEGATRDEIAARLGCARRTVARQLNLIRTIWEDSSP